MSVLRKMCARWGAGNQEAESVESRGFRPAGWMLMLLGALWAAPAMASDKLGWDPKHTFVFAVGIVEWQHPDIWGSFPQEERRDDELVKFFRQAGVPKDQVVYLKDAAATKTNIEAKLAELLGKTDDGDLLIFYFAGHGYRNDKKTETWFACYDAADSDNSGWNVRRLFHQIENLFSGDRALLLADCCHSGAMYDRVQTDDDLEVSYAVMTSSYSHNSSTGSWTFTESLLAGLRGDPQVDLNHDECIDLGEVAHFGEFEMAFAEGQKSMFYSSDDFPSSTCVAWATGKAKPMVGMRLEVRQADRWKKAKIVEVSGDSIKVRYVASGKQEWINADHVRPYQPAQFAEGDRVEVRWSKDGQWYPATIRQAWYGLNFVRYDGYNDSWDEWVGPHSVRLRLH